MNIENLDETLVEFINKYLPGLNWEGENSSASADLTMDDCDCIELELMDSIANAMIATNSEEFTLTIRPKTNKLILYYID